MDFSLKHIPGTPMTEDEMKRQCEAVSELAAEPEVTEQDEVESDVANEACCPCPNCGEKNIDNLEFVSNDEDTDERVKCSSCGHEYTV